MSASKVKQPGIKPSLAAVRSAVVMLICGVNDRECPFERKTCGASSILQARWEKFPHLKFFAKQKQQPKNKEWNVMTCESRKSINLIGKYSQRKHLVTLLGHVMCPNPIKSFQMFYFTKVQITRDAKCSKASLYDQSWLYVVTANLKTSLKPILVISSLRSNYPIMLWP